MKNQLINIYNVENLSYVWMTKTFQKLLGHHFPIHAAFDASFCIDGHIFCLFPIFYLKSILHFIIFVIVR